MKYLADVVELVGLGLFAAGVTVVYGYGVAMIAVGSTMLALGIFSRLLAHWRTHAK